MRDHHVRQSHHDGAGVAAGSLGPTPGRTTGKWRATRGHPGAADALWGLATATGWTRAAASVRSAQGSGRGAADTARRRCRRLVPDQPLESRTTPCPTSAATSL